MYIPEFWVGVVATILSEIIALIIFAAYCTRHCGGRK